VVPPYTLLSKHSQNRANTAHGEKQAEADAEEEAAVERQQVVIGLLGDGAD
jgi:hypothetical protein